MCLLQKIFWTANLAGNAHGGHRNEGRDVFIEQGQGVHLQFRHKHNLTTKACTYAIIIILFNLITDGREAKVYWNQFRGPNGQGVIEADSIPIHFGPESNVLWKTVIPAGHSSVVIWNNRIFFTAVEPANEKELITLCINRRDGKILWQKVVQAQTDVRFHQLNNPASSTPAADEKNVYVYFGTHGLICYDHKGNEIWQRKIETPKSKYGTATSPILYKDKLILVLDGDGGSSCLLAVDRDTGKTVWE
jgi:outer membrane protein assembly factor BamB